MPDTPTRINGQLKFDGTVNIPTIITVLLMVVGTINYLNSVRSDIDRRITIIDTEQGYMRIEMARLEAQQSSLRQDTVTRLEGIRTELRGDLRDVKQSVDHYNLQMRELNEQWRRSPNE